MTQVVQMEYRNPHASMPMYVPMAVICNTPDEELQRNITENSARDLEWLESREPHAVKAIMVGGGPSLVDHLEEIRALQAEGGIVFAMNAASAFLNARGFVVDYQVIADAKDETATLVDPLALKHLFASQAGPLTFEAAGRPIVWHLDIGNIEAYFPPERVARGGYALTGGGGAVGNAALCVAFALGHREFHIFGYDSSHRDDQSHAYDQPMNALIPCVMVPWGGKVFKSSVSMKHQAEKYMLTSQALKREGCELHLYGDGLLQTMALTEPKDMSERDKYALMWAYDAYRNVSPGELIVPKFLEVMKPSGLIVDFGCGTGRASLALREAGHEVYLVDFTDNCRDNEALCLPFLQWDLCHPCPLRVEYGICSDVMEHIPPNDVPTVITNIMGSAVNVFFQISTVPDKFGQAIGQTLHLTVMPHQWWLDMFEALGYVVTYDVDRGNASILAVSRKWSTKVFNVKEKEI
jgi:hypothetical protein